LYFSGFCLKNEEELFSEYLISNDFTVSGFSYGAIKAFEYTLDLIKNNKRVDLLQLFSPSFFQEEDKKFKRMQIMYFKKDENAYINNFLNNIQYPNKIEVNKYLKSGSIGELEILLNYTWKEEDLQLLVDSNVKIEVYLGGNDKIINSNDAKEFFRNFSEVFFIKSSGHILI